MFSGIILIKIFAFFVSFKILNASFCGESTLPYYLKISPKNDLILGCAKPTCLNFPSGAPSNFTSLENGFFDGFTLLPKSSPNSLNISENTECDSEFSETKCFKDGEWIGGIKLQTPDSEKLLFRCCRNSAIKKAKFQTVSDLKINEEFSGGDFYRKGILIGFDYISNIVQFETEQGTHYEIFINRVFCANNNLISSEATTNSKPDVDQNEDKNNIQTQKLYQALISEAENPNEINNVDGLQNINTAPQAGVGAGPEGGETCSNILILTRTGRGIDERVTQISGIDEFGRPILTVICNSTNPNAPLILNWFEQNEYRISSNGFGTVIRNLTCNNGDQRVLNQPNESGAMPAVDQVECITGTPLQPPPVQQIQPAQYVPQQQPIINTNGFQGAAPVQYPASGYYPVSSNYMCFSADTFVTTMGGIKKRMDELKVNDWILSGNTEKGGIGYAKVASWLHRKQNLNATFLKFTLQNGSSIKITGKHYIYKGDCESDKITNFNNFEMVYAEKLSIHDCLFTLHKNNQKNEFKKSRILKIEVVQERGIYAPLTTTGNIIVNEILASCYSNVDIKNIHFSLPSFTEKVKSVLSSISLHHLSSSLSSSLSNELDLVPGFNVFVNILRNILPHKFYLI